MAVQIQRQPTYFTTIRSQYDRLHKQFDLQLARRIKKICDSKMIDFNHNGYMSFYFTDQTTAENEWHSDFINNENEVFEDYETELFLSEVIEVSGDFGFGIPIGGYDCKTKLFDADFEMYNI